MLNGVLEKQGRCESQQVKTLFLTIIQRLRTLKAVAELCLTT